MHINSQYSERNVIHTLDYLLGALSLFSILHVMARWFCFDFSLACVIEHVFLALFPFRSIKKNTKPNHSLCSIHLSRFTYLIFRSAFLIHNNSYSGLISERKSVYAYTQRKKILYFIQSHSIHIISIDLLYRFEIKGFVLYVTWFEYGVSTYWQEVTACVWFKIKKVKMIKYQALIEMSIINFNDCFYDYPTYLCHSHSFSMESGKRFHPKKEKHINFFFVFKQIDKNILFCIKCRHLKIYSNLTHLKL